jgi:hypothetical protein
MMPHLTGTVWRTTHALALLVMLTVWARPAVAAGESYIRVTLSVPARSVLDSLERVLPSGELTRPAWEPVNDSLEMRWSARRDPVHTVSRGDTVFTSWRVPYHVEARGRRLGTVSCGNDAEPLNALVGVVTRLGWRSDWSIDTRSSPIASVHSERCKPKPPGVNFTEILAPRLDGMFHPRAAVSLDTLWARDRRAPTLVKAVWSALGQPFQTRVEGLTLDLAPRRIVAATPLWAGDRVSAELTVVVSPRFLWNATADPGAPLPENQVRLAGDVLEIAFMAVASFDTLESRALARCRAHHDLRGPLEVQSLRVTGDGARLNVEVATRGAGIVRLSGDIGYDAEHHTMGVTRLDMDAASARSLRSRTDGSTALAALTHSLESGLQHDLTDGLVLASAQAGRALNRDLAPGIRIEGGVFARRAERVVVEKGSIRADMVLVGKARIHAEPAAPPQ